MIYDKPGFIMINQAVWHFCLNELPAYSDIHFHSISCIRSSLGSCSISDLHK